MIFTIQKKDYQEVITHSADVCFGYNVMESSPLLSKVITDDDLDIKLFYL